MALWWRIHLPKQETRVQSLVQEDPTCCQATKLVHHNYWACALESRSCNCWSLRSTMRETTTMTHPHTAAAAAAKSLQLCPTLCDPIDGSPPGSSVPGILQARILEWVAISFSSGWKWKVKVKSLSCVGLLATTWTVAYQALLSMGFSRQECWSGFPFPSPEGNGRIYLKYWNGKIYNQDCYTRQGSHSKLMEK